MKVVKEAIARGATPEEISRAIPWKRVFISIEAVCDQQEFMAKMPESMAESGRPFDSRRFFTADAELIHVGPITYAFTNQWGRHRTFQAIESVIQLIRADDISFTPTV